MIKLEKSEVMGWDHAIRGMRNPMNSWDKSDSSFCSITSIGDCRNPKEFLLCEDCGIRDVTMGPNDLKLMQNLVKSGTDHSKFMRMITVYVDITAPLYWWKEFDTYKVGTVANSCSTMHKIQAKEFTLDDFSCEHLIDYTSCDEQEDIFIQGHPTALCGGVQLLSLTINVLNLYRKQFIETKDKTYWWQMIQLLPSSYNQKRTVMLNYQVLRNMYFSRRNHKLDEWQVFCEWIESLPYAKELICLEK